MNKRQTVFFLLVNLMDKELEDPGTIDLKAPRLAQYMQTAWKKHRNTVYWVDIREGSQPTQPNPNPIHRTG